MLLFRCTQSGQDRFELFDKVADDFEFAVNVGKRTNATWSWLRNAAITRSPIQAVAYDGPAEFVQTDIAIIWHTKQPYIKPRRR